MGGWSDPGKHQNCRTCLIFNQLDAIADNLMQGLDLTQLLLPGLMRNILLFWFITSSSVQGSIASDQVDSILANMGYPSADTGAILDLYDEIYTFEIEEPQLALVLYQKGIAWSLELAYYNGVGKGLNYKGIVWFNLGQMDSAIFCAEAALPWFEKSGNQKSYAATLNNIGNVYNVNNNYTEAIRAYQKANMIFEVLEEDEHIVSNLNNIGNMLLRSGNADLGEPYLQEALEKAKQINYATGLGDVNNNMGSLYQKKQQHKHALNYFQKALRHYKETGEPNFIAQAHSNIGQCCENLGDLQCALEHLSIALAMIKPLDLPREQINVMTNLSMVHNKKQEFEKALSVATEALLASQKLGDRVFEMRILESMIISREGLEDYKKAYQDRGRLLKLTEKKFDTETNSELLNLERQYESEKKERKILEQALMLQKKSSQNRLVIILSGSLTLLAILGLLWFRSRLKFNKKLTAQQAKLQAQHLKEIQRKQQVRVLKAMLEGQEKERNRIARDLHDGLGGTLAATKLHVTSMFNQMSVAAQPVIKQKTTDLLNHAADEVRRIAHNMTPVVLMAEGLIPAIEDIANGLRESTGLSVSLQVLGDLSHLTNTQEIMLYRIIQELVQNIVKHAQANKVLIQINQFEGELNLVVEDDGRGFDPGSAAKGVGLESIKSRVEFLQGQLEIDSIPAQGTTTLISMPVQMADV